MGESWGKKTARISRAKKKSAEKWHDSSPFPWKRILLTAAVLFILLHFILHVA